MNQQIRDKLKKAYREDQLAKLATHPEFNLAADTGDIDAIGEIATRILCGDVRTKKEMREMRKTQQLLDALLKE